MVMMMVVVHGGDGGGGGGERWLLRPLEHTSTKLVLCCDFMKSRAASPDSLSLLTLRPSELEGTPMACIEGEEKATAGFDADMMTQTSTSTRSRAQGKKQNAGLRGLASSLGDIQGGGTHTHSTQHVQHSQHSHIALTHALAHMHALHTHMCGVGEGGGASWGEAV